MVGFMGKRKELEQVVDVLSDFSLSGPAPKSRRLVSSPLLWLPNSNECYKLFLVCSKDPGLPPIMEEEAAAPPSMGFEPNGGGFAVAGGGGVAGSEDRALVLYRPVDSHVVFGPGPSGPSILVSSDLIRGLKNHAFDQGNNHGLEDKSPARSNCLAVVPWVPPQIAMRSAWPTSELENAVFEEPMEADETEATSMEVEQAPQTSAEGIDGESLHQWQQHCMSPHSLPNPSAPVMWSR